MISNIIIMISCFYCGGIVRYGSLVVVRNGNVRSLCLAALL